MTTLGNLGARYDLKVVRGADLGITIIVSESGVVKDLTGYTASLVVKRSDRGATLLTKTPVITAIEGAIAVAIADTETDDEAWTCGVYTLSITSSGGVITRLLDGEIELVYRTAEGDEPATSITVETVNNLTLDIVPFDLSTNATRIRSILVSTTPPATGQVLRAASTSELAWSTLTIPNTVAAGDLLHASAANVVSALAAVAIGSVLLSAGIGAAPAYGKVANAHIDDAAAIAFTKLEGVPALATHIQAVDKGGTNLTGYAIGDLIYASGATTLAKRPIGTARQVLQVNTGATAPEWTSALSVTSAATSADLTVGGKQSVTGTALGALAIAGNFYNHCLVTVGHNATNPLTERHQVAFYTSLKGNSFASGANDGFVIGFETGLGSEAGVNVDGGAMSFSAGSYANGAGSTVRSVTAYAFVDETAGSDGNAAICRFNDVQAGTLTGNWFIYYSGTRQSYFGAKITVNGHVDFINDLAQAGTASFSRMSGGTAGLGGNIIAFGNTHATLANQVHMTATGGIVVTSPVVTLSGVTSTDIARNATTSFLRMSGGTAGVGATLVLFGSTHATDANEATLTASGGLAIAAPTTITGATNITGATAVTGALSCTGDLTTGTEILRAVTNSYIRVSGGTVGDGGNISFFGSTHATNANKVSVDAAGGFVITGATVHSGVTSTEISKEATTSFLRISGGTAGNGGNIVFYGSTHATDASEVVLTASGGLTITAATTITGAVAITGALSCTGNLTAGGEILRSVTNASIRMSGGTVGDGGNVIVFGSTHATSANKVSIDAAGGLVITGATVFSGVTSTELSKDATTSFLRVSGGTAGVGANIILYGSTHATDANKMVITASAGVTVFGALTATLTGNASTATALQTPRDINGVAFDGTANITVGVAYAGLPTGNGSWDTGAATTLTITRNLTVSGTFTGGAPAGSLTGATLAAGVTASSLTTLGTLTALTINSATVTLDQDTNFVLSGGVNGVSFDGTTMSIDALNNRVGFGTPTPAVTVDVVGTFAVSSTATITGALTLTAGITNGLIFTGGPSGNGEISRNNDTTYVRIFGGVIATANTPAIALFGASHATLASTVAVTALNGMSCSGSIKSSHATGGVGYATGAGGTVTQATSKATTVVLNKACGDITTHGAALAATTTVSFQLTNSAIALTDTISIEVVSGAATPFSYWVEAIAGSGLATVRLHNRTAGSLSETLVLRFTITKVVTS